MLGNRFAKMLSAKIKKRNSGSRIKAEGTNSTICGKTELKPISVATSITR